MSTTMVTGGIGFIGRYVVDLLAAAGGRVVSYNRDFASSERPNVATVQGELFDLPALTRALKTHGVDRIIHTAAMSHPDISIELPLTTVAANIDGTVHLYEAARAAGVSRIVNFSSECAYGHQLEGPVREDAKVAPRTPYGVTKVATELMGDVYSDLYGLDVISLRVSEVYGPGLRMPEILKEMIEAAVHGTSFVLDEGAEHPFQFVHADDVALAAVLAAGTDRATQRVYNVSGGCQTTIGEAAELIRARFPQADLQIGGGFFGSLDRQAQWDLSAATRDLGYEPRWTLEAGIGALAEHLATHPC
jgi:UDP-glucose 4-epimerase